jgi:hypothetical protein
MAPEMITANFARERETKRTIRFKEVVADDATPAIGTLYVQKPVFAELGSPDSVRVQVAVSNGGDSETQPER